MDKKYIEKKELGLESIIFPILFFGFFAVLAMKMGLANEINTIMNTAYELLVDTVLYIAAVCVVMGAVSELLVEFGFVNLANRFLKHLMRPIFGLPGAASLGVLATFLSDNPAILTLAENPRFKQYFKAYQFPALTNIGTSFGMGLIVCTYMMSLSTVTGTNYVPAVGVGLLGACIGAVVSTRIMMIFTSKKYGKELSAKEVFPSDNPEDQLEASEGMRLVRPGDIGNRILGAILEGGAGGAKLGASIIPGVLIICTVIMMLMNGPSESGEYTGAAYEGVRFIPYIADKLNFILEPLFGFSSADSIGVPLTALGAAGAALGLTSTLAGKGMITPGDIAVFTAICMCWSGYLSTHTSMMDALKCKELTGKSIFSHTIGGLAAGIAAHWIYVPVSNLFFS